MAILAIGAAVLVACGAGLLGGGWQSLDSARRGKIARALKEAHQGSFGAALVAAGVVYFLLGSSFTFVSIASMVVAALGGWYAHRLAVGWIWRVRG